MWGMSSESSTSSSEDEGERGTFHYTAEYFLKKLVQCRVHSELPLIRGPGIKMWLDLLIT